MFSVDGPETGPRAVGNSHYDALSQRLRPYRYSENCLLYLERKQEALLGRFAKEFLDALDLVAPFESSFVEETLPALLLIIPRRSTPEQVAELLECCCRPATNDWFEVSKTFRRGIPSVLHALGEDFSLELFEACFEAAEKGGRADGEVFIGILSPLITDARKKGGLNVECFGPVGDLVERVHVRLGSWAGEWFECYDRHPCTIRSLELEFGLGLQVAPDNSDKLGLAGLGGHKYRLPSILGPLARILSEPEYTDLLLNLGEMAKRKSMIAQRRFKEGRLGGNFFGADDEAEIDDALGRLPILERALVPIATKLKVLKAYSEENLEAVVASSLSLSACEPICLPSFSLRLAESAVVSSEFSLERLQSWEEILADTAGRFPSHRFFLLHSLAPWILRSWSEEEAPEASAEGLNLFMENYATWIEKGSPSAEDAALLMVSWMASHWGDFSWPNGKGALGFVGENFSKLLALGGDFIWDQDQAEYGFLSGFWWKTLREGRKSVDNPSPKDLHAKVNALVEAAGGVEKLTTDFDYFVRYRSAILRIHQENLATEAHIEGFEAFLEKFKKNLALTDQGNDQKGEPLAEKQDVAIETELEQSDQELIQRLIGSHEDDCFFEPAERQENAEAGARLLEVAGDCREELINALREAYPLWGYQLNAELLNKLRADFQGRMEDLPFAIRALSLLQTTIDRIDGYSSTLRNGQIEELLPPLSHLALVVRSAGGELVEQAVFKIVTSIGYDLKATHLEKFIRLVAAEEARLIPIIINAQPDDLMRFMFDTWQLDQIRVASEVEKTLI